MNTIWIETAFELVVKWKGWNDIISKVIHHSWKMSAQIFFCVDERPVFTENFLAKQKRKLCVDILGRVIEIFRWFSSLDNNRNAYNYLKRKLNNHNCSVRKGTKRCPLRCNQWGIQNELPRKSLTELCRGNEWLNGHAIRIPSRELVDQCTLKIGDEYGKSRTKSEGQSSNEEMDAITAPRRKRRARGRAQELSRLMATQNRITKWLDNQMSVTSEADQWRPEQIAKLNGADISMVTTKRGVQI